MLALIIMEEALEILWTYARREPLDSNGETIVPTINNSIAAIRIIMRLEGWAMGSEKRKIKPSENLELGYVGEKRATHDLPASKSRGEWQFAQPKNANPKIPNHNILNHKIPNTTRIMIRTIIIRANCHSSLHLLNTILPKQNSPNLTRPITTMMMNIQRANCSHTPLSQTLPLHLLNTNLPNPNLPNPNLPNPNLPNPNLLNTNIPNPIQSTTITPPKPAPA